MENDDRKVKFWERMKRPTAAEIDRGLEALRRAGHEERESDRHVVEATLTLMLNQAIILELYRG